MYKYYIILNFWCDCIYQGDMHDILLRFIGLIFKGAKWIDGVNCLLQIHSKYIIVLITNDVLKGNLRKFHF